MSKRENPADNYSYPAWRSPEMTPARRIEMSQAGQLTHEANPSDPFARSRVMLYMRRGLALPSEVIADARSQIEARNRAKASA